MLPWTASFLPSHITGLGPGHWTLIVYLLTEFSSCIQGSQDLAGLV
jgi:hypothetical protein